MMPRTDDAVIRVRAQLPCSLRGNAPLRRTADTGPAASAADCLPDDVVSEVRPSTTVLLLGRWPLPAGPEVELLMGRRSLPVGPRPRGRLLMPRSPLLWLWMSLLLLPCVRLLWLLSLPWEGLVLLLPGGCLLRVLLLLMLLVTTIVVALALPSALPASSAGSTSSPGSVAARRGNG